MTLTLYTVNGTGSYPTDPTNFPSMVALALQSPWQFVADQLDGLATNPLINWIPTDYPMATYPMGASVNTGIQVLGNNIAATPLGTQKGMAIYSQGGIVGSTIWRDHILSPAGELHAYLPDFQAGGTVTWGNPLRCPTISANGNTYAGWAQQSGGGISGTNNLTAAQTPSWWLDFADPNDLYTDCPVGTAAGEDETLIYNMVVTSSFGGTLEGLLTLVESAIEQFHQPLAEVIGIATAIWNGLTFAGAGMNAGHYTYNVAPAIGYLQSVATQYA